MTIRGTGPVLDDAARARLIEQLLREIRERYVFPDIAVQVEASIRGRLAAGEYDGITAGEALAEALTSHLREASRDKHFRLRYYPQPQPLREDNIYEDPAWIEEYKVEAALDNYGIHEVKRLAGNVGYIRLTSLDEAEYTAEAVVAAMALVSNTSALIIDVRRNTGGAPSGVAFWCSYFFPPEPVHLNDVYCRETGATQQYWTLPHVPGRRYLDRPVYVLTSSRTPSGAEEFAYDLKHQGRATIVGETTVGAANPVDVYQLSPHFELQVPTCRAINPVTGANWEGVGVEPDIAVGAEDALIAAHVAALEELLSTLGDEQEGPRAALAEEARTTLAGMEGHVSY